MIHVIVVCLSCGNQLWFFVMVVERKARYKMELKALNEALVAALTLDLKRVSILCDRRWVNQYVSTCLR